MRTVLTTLRKLATVAAIALFAASCTTVFLPETETNPWEVISLETNAVFSDIAMLDQQHGWLVGSRSTLLETTDGGKTWELRQLDLEDEQKYTFTSVSFNGPEGWVVGLPSILLHTTDGGQSWDNIPLSPELPGAPFMVTALGKNTAEMATDVGAIYLTKDGGSNWKAQVEGAVGVVRNMTRDSDTGRYVAVSSRGNFYSTWEPGDRTWQPHNRENSKRLQNMGFNRDGSLWLIARGGQMQFGDSTQDYEAWQEPINPELSTSWGLLDLAYRTPDELWVTGGSGNLLVSRDGGETWLKDRDIEDVPTNLYRVKFLSPQQGFILGQRGYLLRYDANAAAAA
ncbi:MAG: photosynthesis system II assembly factor Ycf48 [Leptolyngbya sp. SIO4C1]|nr:photosynthesis system II assembly factor Ycf48 [Leptolyngbya sp. SIO4C1]